MRDHRYPEEVRMDGINRTLRQTLSRLIEVKNDYEESFRALLLDVLQKEVRQIERIKFGRQNGV